MRNGNEFGPNHTKRSANLRFQCSHTLGIARLLLPKRKTIQNQNHQGCTLYGLYQILWSEVRQQEAVNQAAKHSTHQQHGVHQRHYAGASFFTGLVSGQSQAGRLRSLQACTHHQESHCCSALTHPIGHRHLSATRQDQKRKGHDRQSQELNQGAAPHVRHSAPTKSRHMHIRLITGHRPERRHQQRQCQHHGYQPSRYTQFHNHHTVQRPNHEGGCDAHGEFEQRQAQQPRHGQSRAGHVGKGQPGRRQLPDVLGKCLGSHERTHSMALDL